MRFPLGPVSVRADRGRSGERERQLHRLVALATESDYDGAINDFFEF
jgi:hypothetical protein